MSTFTNKELTVCQAIGGGTAVVGLIMLAIGVFAKSRGIGVPEYVTGLRGSGGLLVLIGLVFAALATVRRATND